MDIRQIPNLQTIIGQVDDEFDSIESEELESGEETKSTESQKTQRKAARNVQRPAKT